MPGKPELKKRKPKRSSTPRLAGFTPARSSAEELTDSKARKEQIEAAYGHALTDQAWNELVNLCRRYLMTAALERASQSPKELRARFTEIGDTIETLLEQMGMRSPTISGTDAAVQSALYREVRPNWSDPSFPELTRKLVTLRAAIAAAMESPHFLAREKTWTNPLLGTSVSMTKAGALAEVTPGWAWVHFVVELGDWATSHGLDAGIGVTETTKGDDRPSAFMALLDEVQREFPEHARNIYGPERLSSQKSAVLEARKAVRLKSGSKKTAFPSVIDVP